MTCKRCDRPDCPTLTAPCRCDEANDYICERHTVWSASGKNCRAHAVDWRARALAAEAKVAELEAMVAHALRGE